MQSFLLLLRLAARNIFSSFLNVIIGLIILGGTLFFVVGGSLLNSMDESMSRSIIGSAAGHAHVYQGTSKDTPSLFEGWQIPDLDPVPDFSAIKPVLESHPNVAQVVPEGADTAIVVIGNTMDQILEKLRKAYKARAKADKIGSLKSHVKQMVMVIKADFAKLSKVASKAAVDPDEVAALKKASSDAFWAAFDADPLGSLEFLENKIAYLVPDSDQIFLQYIGTDLDAFSKAFDRLQVVDGRAVPKGRRGILISKYVYETQFKLKTAWRLDQIREGLKEKNKSIAKDPDIQDLVKQNRLQTREITLQLDPLNTQKALGILQQAMGSKEADLPKLLSSFLDTKDADFDARYKLFYDELAPMLELYRMRPGDTMTVKAYSKSGYVQAVNLKIYGTFQFKGLEKSGLSGAISLMDLMSYRDLYGYITPDKLAETAAMKRASGAKAVSREDAEAALFGDVEASVVQSSSASISDASQMAAGGKVKGMDLSARVYTKEETEKGVVMGAAIILKDPSKLRKTMKELQALSDEKKLGLKVIDWQKAAGNLGQFVTVAKLILLIATAIIFAVALVIINNAVVMATLQRRREFGTMRAIGAQKGFVLGLVLCETVVLGLAFGIVGVAFGSGIMVWLGKAGIPASNEFLYFFFSGPRLFPWLSLGSVLGAFFVVIFVTTLSALYPAYMATRVSPVQAMASED